MSGLIHLHFLPESSDKPTHWEAICPDKTRYEGEIQYTPEGEALPLPPKSGWPRGALQIILKHTLAGDIDRGSWPNSQD